MEFTAGMIAAYLGGEVEGDADAVVSTFAKIEEGRPGALSFLGAMLEQGTKTRSALKISDELEAIGAHDHAAFGWDSGAIGVDVLRERLPLRSGHRRALGERS